MTAVWATIIAAAIAGIASPWVKGRIDRRREADADQRADRATIATLVDHQVERLFKETDRLRAAYREDLADLRRQLAESNERVARLEMEVAEWRSGMHGVAGVWVAIPSSVWNYVRDRLPELPADPFPGEVKGRASLPVDDDTTPHTNHKEP